MTVVVEDLLPRSAEASDAVIRHLLAAFVLDSPRAPTGDISPGADVYPGLFALVTDDFRGDTALGRRFIDQGKRGEVGRLDDGFLDRLLDLLGGGGSFATFSGRAACSAFGSGSGRGF